MEFDFNTNQTVDSLDKVPEKYRGLYGEVAEGDDAGKFTLVEGARGLVADYTGLAKSAAGLRQEKKAASDESASRRVALKSIEDTLTALGIEIGEEGVVPAVETYVKDLQEKVKGGQALKVDMDKLKSQYDTRLSEGLAEKDKELEAMMGTLRKHMITGAANAAIAKHKGSVDLLLPHVQSQCDVVKDDNGEYVVRVKDPEGTYRIGGNGSFMGVEDLVADLKTKDAFARAFESEVPGGTGSTPGSMQRPAPRQNQNREEMSPTDKIRAGLKKGQYVSGRGGTR